MAAEWQISTLSVSTFSANRSTFSPWSVNSPARWCVPAPTSGNGFNER